jgi:hypothetical protein
MDRGHNLSMNSTTNLQSITIIKRICWRKILKNRYLNNYNNSETKTKEENCWIMTIAKKCATSLRTFTEVLNEVITIQNKKKNFEQKTCKGHWNWIHFLQMKRLKCLSWREIKWIYFLNSKFKWIFPLFFLISFNEI